MPDASSPIAKRKWPRARGPHYIEVLKAIHRMLSPEWYLEIGSGRGNSLRAAPGKAIAVDPDFRFEREDLGQRAELHMFHQTSEAFFASGALGKIAPCVDLAFIDGMHLFEYVLQDFIAVEKHCAPDSVILLHDLVPFSHAAAERVWDPEKTKGWSGDVWKMIPILHQYRPELDFTVIDPRPSGLGMISGLDPTNTVLEDQYDAIVAEFEHITLDAFGQERFAGLRPMIAVSDVVAGVELEDNH